MPADKSKHSDYQTIKSTADKSGSSSGDQASLKPARGSSKSKAADSPNRSLTNNHRNAQKQSAGDAPELEAENALPPPQRASEEKTLEVDLSCADRQKSDRQKKKADKDWKLLSTESWMKRNGHNLSYAGLYLFSVLVFFRPYELIPSLAFLSATAFYFAAATIAFYVPAQFANEGNLTNLSTEVKAILAMTLIALLTMPIAKSPALALESFSDQFIKAVLMFIVMVNVLNTRRRLMGMMWLSVGVGVFLSYTAISMYIRGDLKAEGYRVAVDIGGLFGNPNDMALHLVTMTPLIIVLGIAARKSFAKYAYFAMAALFVAANMVTFSRGGFLGLLAALAVLIWKIGRKQRLNVTLISVIIGGLAILLAPGNYGVRILSIFVPGLDPVGSSDQRKDLLMRSLVVTARNPWGIGIGNFPIVGFQNLQTHNAYTQVSSEIGLLGLLAYLIFMISPFRKLAAIERILLSKNQHDWFYYLSIGFQASIIGYMVSSFFAPVAYNWYIYYLIAYAVAFRRIFHIENDLSAGVDISAAAERQENSR